jgi:hypothetical protein
MGNLVNLEGDPEFAKKLEIAGNAAQQKLEFFEEHRLYFGTPNIRPYTPGI